MATANHVLLQRTTLTASASSVTLSSIPQSGYTDLKVVLNVRTSGDQASVNYCMLKMSYNGVSSGYSYRLLYGIASVGAGGLNGSSLSQIDWAGAVNDSTSTANTFATNEIYIPNYLGSSYKCASHDATSESNDTSVLNALTASLWSNTAAINSITFTPETGSFVTGSTFAIYGIANAATTPLSSPKAYGGDVVKTDGTYWYHAFLSSGTFKPQLNLTCDALVVAGGGGGGDYGGGGAGGFRTPSLSLSSTTYAVTVGAGGAGGSRGSNGGDSTISTITSSGGGGGGPAPGSGDANGANGGSGGGGGVLGTTNNGGTGNTPSTSPSQGNNGGAGVGFANYGGGGGGGAGAVGGNGTGSKGGDGGNGTYTSLTDAIGAATGLGQLVSSHYYFAGGAGGSAWMGGSPSTGGAGGYGGGGAGRGKDAGTANAGTPNTGGGGSGLGVGGAGGGPAGGSGIVVIRYPV